MRDFFDPRGAVCEKFSILAVTMVISLVKERRLKKWRTIKKSIKDILAEALIDLVIGLILLLIDKLIG